MQPTLLSTAYLPSLNYFAVLLNNNSVFIEKHEYFIKQSPRTRCEILSSNGKLSLSIPVQNNGDKELISDKKISYAEDWQKKHWRAITSAYRSSAYFDFFEIDFKPFYFEKHEFLLEYNTELIKLIFKLLRQKKEIQFTADYQEKFNGIDLRDYKTTNIKHQTLNNKYYQVFSDKFGFTPNLSIIDLLFNKGLESLGYLTPKL